MELPKRKRICLPDYDYSQNGAYFVTLCAYNKKKLFGDIGENSISARMIQDIFEQVIAGYPQISCPKYVVMPNHFHAIIVVDRTDSEPAPTVMKVLQAFKSRSTLEYIRLVKAGKAPPFDRYVWQRSFYDHVIRNENDYAEIWKYIDNNPQKWQLDRFYVPE